MRIRFTQDFAFGFAVDVTYYCPEAGAPHEGDFIEPDGSDPAFPEDVYVVKRNRWQYTQGGCSLVVVELEPAT